MRSLRQFWSPRRINEGRVMLIRLGPLRLWLSRSEQDWKYATEYGDVSKVMDIAQVPDDVISNDLSWTSVMFKSVPYEFLLKPAPPDRSIVISLKDEAVLPAGETGLFFILLPVFINIHLLNGGEDVLVGRVSSRMLSDTWFGTPVEGHFCYSLPCQAEISLQDISPCPHQIVCPIQIRNASAIPLKFEKFCLRPDFIGIWSGDHHLWSSPVEIVHEGSYKGTGIRYGSKPPNHEPDLLELVKPPRHPELSLSRLTFGSGFKRDVIFTK